MKRADLKKLSDCLRRQISKNFGFRQSGYVNWIVKSGYFFYIKNLRFTDVSLMVKPIFADDLWWDIFGIPENKDAPLSLRGNGAFSVFGKPIATYDFLPGDIDQYSESDIGNLFQEVFRNALRDIEWFMQRNPDADKYMPEKEDDFDRDRLLYFMCLIHNGQTDAVIKAIKELKSNGHKCLYHQYPEDMDSYDYILRWCNNA